MIAELKDDDFPEIYESLVGLLPDRPWVKWVSSLEHQLGEVPLMRSFLWSRNIIAYGLREFDSHGLQPPTSESWGAIKSALIFASQVLLLCRQHSSDGGAESQGKLLGRVRHAIKAPDGMRGLRLELMVATHLSRQGCEIQWMEEDVGVGTFDLLVKLPGGASEESGGASEEPGDVWVEVECKSISADRGEPLTEEEFHLLVGPILQLIEPRLLQVERHFFGISVVFTDKLPKGAARGAVVEAVASAVGKARSGEDAFEVPGVCLVRVVLSDLREVVVKGEGLVREEAYALADHLIGAGNGFRFIKGFGDECYLSIDFQAALPSNFEAGLGSVAKRAVRKQMTGTRPGCLVVGVERHSGASLEQVSRQESDELAQRAAKLLRDSPHLASVVYVSAPILERIEAADDGWRRAGGSAALEGQEEGLVSEGELSRTYAFDNHAGHYPHLRLSRLFGVG
ncbi:hypothetical protein ACF8FG_17820 [Pseudomonas sp. YQ_6]|uniref:hypothetical protein n=1 Tax=Pseudomonas sp. YQ_6 TaxID=3367230 RepID=UPI00370AE33A